MTVVCWYWKGKKPIFEPRHVYGLERQCREKIKRPYRFVCITDQVLDCETFPLWDFPEVKVTVRRSLDCWRRLRVFDPDIGAQLGDRILSIDLCVLLGRDPTDLIDESLSFQAMEGSVSPVAGGLFTLKTGEHSDVWRSFDPDTSALDIEAAKYKGRCLRGSDQAWMSLKIPNASVWTNDDGVWKFPELSGELPDFHVMTFPRWKPWHDKVRQAYPELTKQYESYL